MQRFPDRGSADSEDLGEVTILGADPRGAGIEWRNRVGIVLQSTGGLDLLTPREALASTAKAYSHPRDVADVLTSVGLDDKADTRTRILHGLDTADTHHSANSFTLDPGGRRLPP